VKKVFVIILMSVLAGCGSNGPQINQSVTSAFVDAEKYYAAGKLKMARIQYLNVIKQKPNNYESNFKLANISMRMLDYKRAHYYYAKVLGVKPYHVKSHHNIALAHLMAAEKHIHDYLRFSKTPNVDILKLQMAIKKFIRPQKNDDLRKPAVITSQTNNN